MKWSEVLCPDRVRQNQKTETTAGRTTDLRTEFEKDYHRIISSASFRRLQDKTQVFPLDKSDFVRTRLTHSLEVSSFCKSLGQNIGNKIVQEIRDPEFLPSYSADICDILQCAGLLHDIGNPPFGHFGETVMRRWFREHLPVLNFEDTPVTELLNGQMKQDFFHFEGNTQALRLVSKLHYLIDEHGMNLTKGLLGTMIKYPVSSLGINKESGNIKEKKMGYYYAEQELFENLQESMKLQGSRHPLAFILEAADDIAYKTADIEDAFKKGCISYHGLLDELKKAGTDLPPDSLYHEMAASLGRYYDRAQKAGRSDLESYAVQNWIVKVQGKIIYQVTESFAAHYREIMEGRYAKDLFSGTEAEPIMDVLGEIAYRYAFTTESIFKLELAAKKILDFLLDLYIPAILYYDTPYWQEDGVEAKAVALISDNYKRIYHICSKGKSREEQLYLRFLLVTDFICGMTDTYAKALYQELNGIV